MENLELDSILNPILKPLKCFKEITLFIVHMALIAFKIQSLASYPLAVVWTREFNFV